jgi:catechol 1,2-dioxygenase
VIGREHDQRRVFGTQAGGLELNEIGKLQTDQHNEFVLMAGSLGVSSLLCLLINGDRGQTETSQSLLGPFWRLNSPRVENGGTIIRSETPGTPLFVHAQVVDRDIRPFVPQAVAGPLKAKFAD